MSDIELVIKMSEDSYKATCRGYMLPSDIENVVQGIKNGITLPKGHGKLIDVKDLRLDIIAHKYSNSFCEEHNIDQSINVGMLNILLADAPTIIEANKAESEDDNEV